MVNLLLMNQLIATFDSYLINGSESNSLFVNREVTVN